MAVPSELVGRDDISCRLLRCKQRSGSALTTLLGRLPSTLTFHHGRYRLTGVNNLLFFASCSYIFACAADSSLFPRVHVQPRQFVAQTSVVDIFDFLFFSSFYIFLFFGFNKTIISMGCCVSRDTDDDDPRHGATAGGNLQLAQKWSGLHNSSVL